MKHAWSRCQRRRSRRKGPFISTKSTWVVVPDHAPWSSPLDAVFLHLILFICLTFIQPALSLVLQLSYLNQFLQLTYVPSFSHNTDASLSLSQWIPVRLVLLTELFAEVSCMMITRTVSFVKQTWLLSCMREVCCWEVWFYFAYIYKYIICIQVIQTCLFLQKLPTKKGFTFFFFKKKNKIK